MPGLLLFGGENGDVFLGCLNCSEFDSSSIWNKYGDYGSRYSSTSIWNEYGDYGGKYSDYSPWNPYTEKGPVIVDADGSFYGRFTVNRYVADRTVVPFAVRVLEAGARF